MLIYLTENEYKRDLMIDTCSSFKETYFGNRCYYRGYKHSLGASHLLSKLFINIDYTRYDLIYNDKLTIYFNKEQNKFSCIIMDLSKWGTKEKENNKLDNGLNIYEFVVNNKITGGHIASNIDKKHVIVVRNNGTVGITNNSNLMYMLVRSRKNV